MYASLLAVIILQDAGFGFTEIYQMIPSSSRVTLCPSNTMEVLPVRRSEEGLGEVGGWMEDGGRRREEAGRGGRWRRWEK